MEGAKGEEGGPRLLIIQTCHQALCPRLVYYHEHRERLAAFPPSGLGTAVQAREIGPGSNRAGPCLVLIEGVTASPEGVRQWWRGSVFERFCPRYFLLPAAGPDFASKEALAEALRQVEPPRGPIRLQCHPRELDLFLKDALPLSWELHHSRFEWVLSVVAAEGRLRYGLERLPFVHKQQQQQAEGSSPAEAVPPEGEQEPLALCRAAGKLEEVFAVVGQPLQRLEAAIDLGAAPGGWTMVLAQRAQRVIAVDPAELDPLALQPNVTHLRQKAQDAVARIGALVAGSAATLLVCDVNVHFTGVFALVRSLLPCLPPGSRVVFTLKFVGKGRERARICGSLREELLPELRVEECLWLVANTIHERTVVATRL